MTELGEYYLQYRRLMDHWHETLPGFVLEVNYEDVVADLESQDGAYMRCDRYLPEATHSFMYARITIDSRAICFE